MIPSNVQQEKFIDTEHRTYEFTNYQAGTTTMVGFAIFLTVSLGLTKYFQYPDLSYWLVFGPLIYVHIRQVLFRLFRNGVHAALIAERDMFEKPREVGETISIDKHKIDPSLLSIFEANQR